MRAGVPLRIVVALALGALTLAALGLAACPLSHDGYETDRPCWSELDCVQSELCSKPDACAVGVCPSPENTSGTCAVPSDEVCGADGGTDGGTGSGYYCFPDEQGNPTLCAYELHDRCVLCALDGGLTRDCPEAHCLTWRDRWGCQ
ncbi:MAG: hypothetical protein ABI333_26480 [bacterium]